MPKTIVAAIDGSETGNKVIDCAAELSAKLGMDLSIVHVLLYGRPRRELLQLTEAEHLVDHISAKAVMPKAEFPAFLGELVPTAEDEFALARAIAEAGDQILGRAKQRAETAGATNVKVRPCAGDAADEILDVAEADEAGMIVLGRRGLGRAREMLLGSVSQKVLHHAPCTVVIVP